MNCKSRLRTPPSYGRKGVAGYTYVSRADRGVKKGVHNIALEIISLYGHTPLGQNRQFLHNRWADSLEPQYRSKGLQKPHILSTGSRLGDEFRLPFMVIFSKNAL